jgi:4-carboxymuconolactone decarboxylase
MRKNTGAPETLRFVPLTAEQLLPEQKAYADSIAKPPRNAKFTKAPYRAFIRSPGLAPKLEALSDTVRWNTSLPPRVNEMAILITARHWSNQYVWASHWKHAVAAGLEAGIAVDLAAGRRPERMKEDEAALYDFATELYRDKSVSDATYAGAVASFGERGVMDAIAVMGYYGLVCMTQIAAQAEPADNGAPVLGPPVR